MGCSPVIYSGTRSKVLSQKGFVLRDGSVIDNDGQINYIKNGHFEINTTGWINYGSPTGITFSRSTSSPQRGSASLLFQKDAANRTGQGIEYSFTIDSSDKGKVLQCSFEYQISSGTFADNDMAVWIYDVTNAVLIQPAPYLIKNSGIIEKFAVEFQTAINSTSYKLILLCNSTSNLSYDLKFDNIVLGPQAKLYGSAVTDPVAYTPTFTGLGTVTGINFVSWREGANLLVKGTFTTGTPTATEARISLGFGGANSNVIALSTLPTLSAAGMTEVANFSSTVYKISALIEPSVSYITMGNQASTVGGLLKQKGNDLFGASVTVSVLLKIPIQGWSSSQVMSNDADTRVVALSANTVASTVITNANAGTTKLIPTVVAKDTHGAYNSSTGVYTVPSPGEYTVYFKSYISMASGMQSLAVYVNGTRVAYGTTAYGATTVESDVRYQGTMKAGDTIDIRTNQVSGTGTATIGNNNATGDLLQIAKLSGPAQIAASESVSAIYTGAPPTGTINGSFNITTFGTKVKDSHNAYSGGVYTIPVSGVYDISAQVLVNTTLTVIGSLVQFGISIDGSATPTHKTYFSSQGSVNSALVAFNVKSVPLLAGQTIAMQTLTEGTTNSFSSNVGVSRFSISRAGNY